MYVYLLEKDGKYLIGRESELRKVDPNIYALTGRYNLNVKVNGWTVVDRKVQEFKLYQGGELMLVGTALELMEEFDLTSARFSNIKTPGYLKSLPENTKAMYALPVKFEVEDFTEPWND